MARADGKRLAILGAGPIGLEAALYARRLDLTVQVYERGKVGEHLRQWGHVRLFSPFGLNATPLGKAAIRAEKPDHAFPEDDACLTGREHLAAYLEPLAQTKLLKDAIVSETEVVAVGRARLLKGDGPGDAQRGQQPFRLLLRSKGVERYAEADVVLDCTGTYGRHRWLGDGGLPALGETALEAKIVYGLDDVLGEKQKLYADKTTLVVGGGYSAATSVSRLADLAAKHPDTWVIWLVRSAGLHPLRRVANDPLKERDRLALRANALATRHGDGVEFHNNAVVQAVEPLTKEGGFKVTALVGKTPKTWEVDRLIGNVGFSPDERIYRELQVHECYASLGPMKLAAALLGQGGDCLTQTGHGPETLKTPEPNFFILGAKSYGRNSQFLLRVGFEQVRDVFTLIAGKAGLNLYR